MLQLFLHVWREKIILQGDWRVEELAYLDIERKLPVLLIACIKKYDIEDILVLNGPGSFTTLRLGCLTLNAIKQFGDRTITLYSLSKLALYRYAYEAWVLPKEWYIFIGQKKNMWKVSYDWNEELYWRKKEIVHHDDIQPWTNNYFIDPCEHVCVEKLDRKYSVDISFDGASIHVSYNWLTCSFDKIKLWLVSCETIEPQYCMEPQIW